MDIDIKNIETLLEERKYDQVRSIIAAASAGQFSGEERGAALTGLASIYLDISNAINTRYRDALREVVADIKRINSAENKSSDGIRLLEVKEKLKA